MFVGEFVDWRCRLTGEKLCAQTVRCIKPADNDKKSLIPASQSICDKAHWTDDPVHLFFLKSTVKSGWWPFIAPSQDPAQGVICMNTLDNRLADGNSLMILIRFQIPFGSAMKK